MMKISLVCPLVAALALCMASSAALAQKAELSEIECGPKDGFGPQGSKCSLCKEGGKSYVGTRFVEGAIAKLHRSLKKLTNPITEVEALEKLFEVKRTGQKRWTEQGYANPEIKDTYCWKEVKAEAIKPLKDNDYGLGRFLEGKCDIDTSACYHFTMQCRKMRDEKEWICDPHLQEFKVKDGKCVDSPTATACDCHPKPPYWTCGLNAAKGGKAVGVKGKGRKK
jgi:hypothetical protein